MVRRFLENPAQSKPSASSAAVDGSGTDWLTTLALQFAGMVVELASATVPSPGKTMLRNPLTIIPGEPLPKLSEFPVKSFSSIAVTRPAAFVLALKLVKAASRAML